MTLELERPAAVEARVGSLTGIIDEAERRVLSEQLRSTGLPHEDMRDWLHMVDALAREEFPPAIGPTPEEKRITRERWGWILK